MAGTSNPSILNGKPDELFYFAYGSNMNKEQISARCAKAKVVAVAKLSDFQLAFFGHSVVWDGAEETVVPSPSHDVWGVVYQLSASDQERLDDAQGARLDGSGPYFHFPATVTAADGSSYSVLLFKKDSLGRRLKPSQEYLSFIAQGAADRELPAAYVEALRTMESAKAKYTVPRANKSVREFPSGGDCSQCGDTPAAPSKVINISLGSEDRS
jgi:hypothetical protein